MLIINVIILILFLSGTILCFIYSHGIIKLIDKKEHRLYFLYPLADWVITKTGAWKILNRKKNVTDAIKALNLTAKPELLQRLYWCSRVSLILVVIILFDVFSLFSQLAQSNNSLIKSGRFLLRPDHGQGSTRVELNVTMKQAEASKSSKNEKLPESQKISLDIEERSYTSKELKKIFAEAYQYLKTDVLGKNKSAKQVYKNLKFSESIPGTGIAVDWQPQDCRLIQSDGTINNRNINVKGISTSVHVVLTYRRQKKEYSMFFKVMPRQYSKEELLRKSLREKIITYAKKTAEEAYLELPETLDKYHLSWNDNSKDNSGIVLLLAIFAAMAAWFLSDKELEKQIKKRKEQMLFDYPEIINKFTLLVNAGMTVKQAWNKIAEDYHDKFSQMNKKKRYAYEEMLTTANELKLGIPENIAYEQYGRRAGLIPYIKFSSLISQNLRKGNKGFTDLLMREALEAFEDRKEAAKRMGEEAGTKLLIPMMLMLVIVLLIIMIPAFMSFQI